MSQPSPLAPARQHALALASSGDLDGARQVLERAVELGKANLSEDDPDVLRTSHQLGTILQRVDDPSAARRVLEEAYAAGLWRLGESDALMLEISHDIGMVAEELGNRHEARKAFGRVAELGPGVLGDEHPAVVRARGYLGLDAVSAEAEPTAPLDVVVAPEPSGVQAPPPDHQVVWSPISAPTVAQPVITHRGADQRFPSAAVQQPVSQGGSAPVSWGGSAPASRGHNEPAGGVHNAPVGWGGNEPVRTAAAPLDAGRGARTYRKGLGLFAAIAAGLASIIAVAALVFVLADRGGQEPARKDDVPTLGGPAPSDVRVRDSGSDIEIEWTDPSNGTVSFMVAMGRQGEELKPVATLGPGQTSYELGGLNASLNYCFTVIAVYRSDQFATSPQACTSRAATTPR